MKFAHMRGDLETKFKLFSSTMTTPEKGNTISVMGQSNGLNYAVLRSRNLEQVMCWISVDDIVINRVINAVLMIVDGVQDGYTLRHDRLSESFEGEWFVKFPMTTQVDYFSRIDVSKTVMSKEQVDALIDAFTANIIKRSNDEI